MRTIEVVGNRPNGTPGQLAKALLEYDQYPEGVEMVAVAVPRETYDLAVYCARTDTVLPDTVTYCQQTNTPLAFMSSGIDIDPYLPEVLNFCMIEVPNASIEVIKFMHEATKRASEHQDKQVIITEHHQPSKKDVSGTALKLSALIGENRTKIVSVRDWLESSVACGIPIRASNGYAIHYFDVEDEPDEHLEVRVLGRETYARGISALIAALFNNPEYFTPGRLLFNDLINDNII